jgi:hypothetical protein
MMDFVIVLFDLHVVVEQFLLCRDSGLFGGAESKSGRADRFHNVLYTFY